jgi:hypothetical protein
MAKRKPTLEERERKVAEQEAAIAAVLPLITPALTKISELYERYWCEHEDISLIDTDPREYLRARVRKDAAGWVLAELLGQRQDPRLPAWGYDPGAISRLLAKFPLPEPGGPR